MKDTPPLLIPGKDKQYLSVRELAEYLQVSEKTIYRRASSLPHLRIGGVMRFDPAAVEDCLHTTRKESSRKLNDLFVLEVSPTKPQKVVAAGSPGVSRPVVEAEMLSLETTKVYLNPAYGTYYGKFKDPETNKWKSKCVPATHRTEDAAKAWFYSFLVGLEGSELNRGTRTEEPKETVPVVANRKASSSTAPTIRSLVEKWEMHLRNDARNRDGDPLDELTIKQWLCKVHGYCLTDRIGDLALTESVFTWQEVSGWIERISKLKSCRTGAKTIAPYTIRDCVLALRTFIDHARKKAWVSLPFNPARDQIVKTDIPIACPLSGSNNPIHLTEKQAIQLITAESPKIPLNRKVKNLLGLCTGSRENELQALSWGHIDLANRLLRIDRQVKKGGSNPVFKAPKKKSDRTIPLHRVVVEALTHYKSLSAKTGANDPVFPDREGFYFKSCQKGSGAARLFRDDLTYAGLPTLFQGQFNFDFHATRRTFLTMLADAGVSDENQALLAGHKIAGVRKHYVAEHPERFIPEIEKLPFGKVKLPWITQ